MIAIVLLAAASIAGVRLLSHAGDAICHAAGHIEEVYPDAGYFYFLSPCDLADVYAEWMVPAW